MSTVWGIPLDIALLRIKRIKAQSNLALYEIEPLEPGYGVTIAHALKRVMVSSLPGAAVVALLFDEAVSDVLKEEILLNTKQIRLRCLADHPVSMRLEASSVGVVTAADLIADDTIEIMNPDLQLATLEDALTHVAVEMIVQRGRGYVPVEKQSEHLLGVIPIDAIYTPVRKINYIIEHTRVGKMVNFEKVLLEVETDATMTPDEALCQGGEILQKQFLALSFPQGQTYKRKATQSDEPIPTEIYNLPLEHLNLSVRTYNALKRNGHLTTVGQVLTLDEDELRDIRNVGDKALLEIQGCLQLAGCFPRIDPFGSLPGQFPQSFAAQEPFSEVSQVQNLPESG